MFRIKHHEYDPANKVLCVSLSNGKTYTYTGIEEIVYYALLLELRPEQFLPEKRKSFEEHIAQLRDQHEQISSTNQLQIDV